MEKDKIKPISKLRGKELIQAMEEWAERREALAEVEELRRRHAVGDVEEGPPEQFLAIEDHRHAGLAADE